MTEHRQWMTRRVIVGVLLTAGGLALFAGSLAATALSSNSTFDYRIVGGLGIALAGSGLAFVVKYGAGLRDDRSARRIAAEDLDERSILIRQRAGARAFWVSMLIVFGGLMWTSFAANGKLAAIEGDALWNFLALAVVVPFAVYVGSLLVDEHNG